MPPPNENFSIAEIEQQMTGVLSDAAVNMPPLTPNHCTDIMLKAHAVRLNPNAHATELIRTSDLMDLLRPTNSVDK